MIQEGCGLTYGAHVHNAVVVGQRVVHYEDGVDEFHHDARVADGGHFRV